jgi:hypothetical protein
MRDFRPYFKGSESSILVGYFFYQGKVFGGLAEVRVEGAKEGSRQDHGHEERI